MQRFDFKKAIILVMALIGLSTSIDRTATAQTVESCSQYILATSGSKEKVPVVSEELLTDWNAALPCLLIVIRNLKDSVSGSSTSVEAKSSLLSVTAALKNIISRLTANDQNNVGGKSNYLLSFIGKFRSSDDIDVVSVLTYGATSDIYDIRLNSVIILGNIIDNSTVCVPLTYLNDPTILASEVGLKGRINLLSIVSVVAPWAYKENFDSIQATINQIRIDVENDKLNLQSTIDRLSKIQQRLNSQNLNSNKSVNLPKAWDTNCKIYVESYLPALPDARRKNLTYFAP